jgi:serine/threonine protein kinase
MSDEKSSLISFIRYQVEAPLVGMTSAYADLYQAKDTITKRKVVLKVFKPELIKDYRTRSRLMQILQRNADLVHPHIAWVWDIGEEGGKLFSAERFIQGQTLEEKLVKGRRLDWDICLPAFRQFTQALDFLHTRNIVHGELNTKNVRFDPEHGVILFDIGLSQAFIPTITTASGQLPLKRTTQESDQVDLTRVFIQMLAGTAAPLTAEGMPVEWPFGVPQLIEPALRRGLGISQDGHYPSNNDYYNAILEFSNSPQPEPTSEELARHQAEVLAWQVADEAERQQAEEASRQVALEAAKKEIDEQLQQTQGEQPASTSQSKEPIPEAVQREETQPPSETGTAVVEQNPDITTSKEDVNPVIEPDQEPADKKPKKKKQRRWGCCLVIFLIIIVLILVIAGTWYAVAFNPPLPVIIQPWIDFLREWIANQAWLKWLIIRQ